jgi:hypothetical protein
MSSDPQAAAIHASDQPASQPALAAAAPPLVPVSTAALVAPSTGLQPDVQGATPVMTNVQLTQGLLGILQRLEALQQALLAIQPGLQQLRLPSSLPVADSLPRPPAPPRARPPRCSIRPPAYRST